MSFFLGSKPKAPTQGSAADQNAYTGLAGPAIKLEDHTNTVFCCAFSDHSSSSDVDLATASYDGTTRIWDVSKSLSGSKKANCKTVLKGNSGGVWCCTYSPGSEWLVSGCSKATLAIYSVQKKYQQLGVLKLAHGPNAIFTAAIGKDNILATGGGDNNLKLWKIVGEEGGAGAGAGAGGVKMPLASLATLSSHSGDVVSCAFRPNSSLVASGSEDRHIRVWDYAAQDCVQTLIGHTAEVCSCSYDGSGGILASGSSDKCVRLWDARSKNKPIRVLEGHKASVYSCTFNRGGAYEVLATASQDCTVLLWDPRTWKCCQVVKHHLGEVVGLAFHPHGLALATGSADMTVALHPMRSAGPTDADLLAVDAVRLDEKKADMSPGPAGLAGQKRGGGSPTASPMVMEVRSDVGVSPMVGPATFNGPPIGDMGSSSRTFLAASASSRHAVGKVSHDVRQQLESEIAHQKQLLGMAMDGLAKQGANGDTPPPPADPADVEDLRRRLTAFYLKVNPAKLANVDVIVRDYATRGGGATERAALNEDLRAVYGRDMTIITAAELAAGPGGTIPEEDEGDVEAEELIPGLQMLGD